MDRRTMLQYLASVAAGGATLGNIAGCATGAPQSPSGRKPNGDSRPDPGRPQKPTEPSAGKKESKAATREVRARHLYLANPLAPGVDIREFGFKRAVMLPAKTFTDPDGMSLRPKMQREIAERVAQTGEPDFRGPFIFDMEGAMFASGLASTIQQEYEMSARRINAALQDIKSIIPGAMVSVYGSPFVRKTREDYATASRAVQRLQGMTFLNPSLYEVGPGRNENAEAEIARVRRDYIAFACEEAKRLGIELVLPMVYHRYKGAAQPKNEQALSLIDREKFQANQITSSRDGGAHGIILWHSDLHSMRIASNPNPRVDNRVRQKTRRQFENVSQAELIQTHRDVLRSINEAFLSDD